MGSSQDNSQITALVIPAQSTPYYKTASWTLEELQKAVGGLIESLPHSFEKTVIYGNDEAKFRGPNGGPMPLNVRATEALRHMLHPGDFIAGDVVVLGVGRDGYDDNVNRKIAETLKSGKFMIVTPDGDLIEI